MRSMVYETSVLQSVRLSVCPSVCPIDRQQQQRAAGLLGLLLWVRWARDVDR